MTFLDFFLLFVVLAGLTYLFMFGYRKQKEWKQNRPSPYVEGLNALIRGDLSKAIEKLKETARRDTDNIDAYLKIGDILRDTGQHEQAISIHRDLTVRSALKAFQKVDILYSLALDYQANQQYEKALETANEMLSLDKNDVRTYELKLELEEQNKIWEDAYKTLLKLQHLKNMPKEVERLSTYKVNAGLAYLERGEGREGRIRFKEAIKVDVTCAPAYLHIGDSYREEGREEEAVRFWKELITVSPEQGHLAFSRLEDYYFQHQSFSDIENIYRSTLEADPQNEAATISLAQLNQKVGDTRHAIRLLESYVKENNSSIAARRELVQILKNNADYDKMAEHALVLADLCMNRNGNQ